MILRRRMRTRSPTRLIWTAYISHSLNTFNDTTRLCRHRHPSTSFYPTRPPPPPLRSTISLAPDSGDYLNALSSAVIAGIAVVLLGYACYLRRRSQSVALRARTRLSGEDNASTSAVVELEQPTASWRRDEVADTCTHLDECSSLPYTVPYGKNMNMWRTIFAQAQPLPPPV